MRSTWQRSARALAPRRPTRCRSALPRSCPSKSCKAPCPNFRGSRIRLGSLGVRCGVELCLPRIRRSPCETDSAAIQRGRQGTWNKWKGPDGARRWWEGGRLCRERLWRPRARRYGSHRRRTANAGRLDAADERYGRSKEVIPKNGRCRVHAHACTHPTTCEGLGTGNRPPCSDSCL